ncbi:MAG: hypothetical protein GF418_16300 [Chitinivibrionales bacterium]|nr:hypothetical protein [Chitinivibrionales bacterium]MBD3397183.1 hypothetical protein [Chitinivibrionales bacterium]
MSRQRCNVLAHGRLRHPGRVAGCQACRGADLEGNNRGGPGNQGKEVQPEAGRARERASTDQERGGRVTIVLPEKYRARDEFARRNIPSITEEQALREDIRALRIGLVNLAGCGPEYEADLLQPMGRSVMQIEPVWIRLKTYAYEQASTERVSAVYSVFEDAIRAGTLDGIIVAGESDGDVDFEKLAYWAEISRILKYAGNNVPSTLGLGWGAQVIAAFHGIPSRMCREPAFGIYQARNLNETHRITCIMDDVFDCPVRRRSAVDTMALGREHDKGSIALLAETDETGTLLAETKDQRFLMHFGHPEYTVDDIIERHRKDSVEGAAMPQPAHIDITSPVNTWRGHSTALFTQWIKYIHETRSY